MTQLRCLVQRRGTEDRWSDIDLALTLTPGAEPSSVAERWTKRLQQEETVIDHLDIHASGALYRVFLLGSTLQVDLSFWPHGQFVTGAAPVQMLFGQADDTVPAASQEPVDHLRLAWLYALHVRSALARSRQWQALWMLEGIRNELVALYCVRYGLATQEGRGVDQLPGYLRSGLATTLVTTTQLADLRHTFSTLVALILTEADRQALPVPAGLAQTLEHLIVSVDATHNTVDIGDDRTSGGKHIHPPA